MNKLTAVYQAILGLLEQARRLIEPVLTKVFGPLELPPEAERMAYRGMRFESEVVMARQEVRHARKIVRAVAVVLVLFLVWASIAVVEEVTKGEGKVIPSARLQVLQSLDGGVVDEILVKEGQVVEAGQLLLKIDATRAESGVREARATSYALMVKEARLKALAEGTEFKPPQGGEGEDDRRILAEEENLYRSKMSELSALVSINRQQVEQRQQELAEARARKSSAEMSRDSMEQELHRTKPLLASGAVSELEVIRLERELNRVRSEVRQTEAQMLRIQAAISEASRKVQETELAFRNEARKELSEVLGKLSSLNQSQVALADKVDKTAVTSPVRGRIQRLMANTVGGVVQPGKDIVEVVPLNDTLLLEARVAPRDIAFIRPEQAAMVKFTAYDFSIYGGLEAKVENISPDTVVDERGNAFYVVRVRTIKPNFGEKLQIYPGMTAEVDILTGKKTVLSYLLKPVIKAKAYALRER